MLSAIVSFTLAAATGSPLVSNFAASAESWTVQTRTNPAGAFSVSGNYTPDHLAAGGNEGGYIEEVDPDNQWSFFRAPAAWNGNRSSFSGRALAFSTRTDALTFPDGRLVVLIGNNGQVLSHAAAQPPLNTWTRRRIPLAQGAWRTGASASGAVATQAQIDAVLADLEGLLIGMEWGGELLEERVGLDSVVLGACPADLTTTGSSNGIADGLVDISDFSFYLTLWAAGDAGADVTTTGTSNGTPDGAVDVSDYSYYLTLWAAGCP